MEGKMTSKQLFLINKLHFEIQKLGSSYFIPFSLTETTMVDAHRIIEKLIKYKKKLIEKLKDSNRG